MNAKTALRRLALVLALAPLSSAATSRDDGLAEALRDCKTIASAPGRISACTFVLGQTRDKSMLGQAYNRRGHANVELKRFTDAARDFSEVIRLNPTVAGYYDNRQNAYRQAGRLDEALQDANAAVRLAPTFTFVLRGRANVYDDMGRTDLAIQDFTRAIQMDPRDAGLLGDRARLYTKVQRAPDALNDLTAAIAIDPTNVGFLRDRGLVNIQLGWREAARSDLTAYLRAQPGDSEASQALAKLSVSTAPVVAAVQVPPTAAVATPALNSAIALPENRVALVIANSAYSEVGSLENPVRDAAAIAEALRSIGFRTVKIGNDLGFDGMRRALSDFAAEAERADWAVVYYAGHGIEVAGTNYLVPIDARLRTDRAIFLEAVSLDQVIGSIEGARKLRLVILDACRDNPFIQRMSRSEASRSIGRGLARVEPGGSTLVAYSAKAGQVASDGVAGERNSPFAAALIRRIVQPRVEIRKFFGLVRDDVLASTDRRQDPAVYGSLGGDDYFLNVR